jgi:hypothetical protein
MLAVAPDGLVQGHYLESQGDKPAKRCSFLLRGRSGGPTTNIESWSRSAGVLPGTLVARGDGVSLAIPGGRDHDGCGLVLPPLVDRGLELSKVAEGSWRQLLRVREPRLWFRAEPAASAPRSGYVVRGDVVGVLRALPGWTSAEFVDRNTGRRKRGWLESAGLDPLDPAPAGAK